MNTLPKGVYCANKKDNSIYYRASITFHRKHVSLGSFSSIEEAHASYLEANRILYDTSLSLHAYENNSPLSFEKWVILINFRDNGLYLSTPIYVRAKFFFYYLSPDHVFTFDIDDLFYYSSHKIMQRDGHFFVADYGMQINIFSRYGIRNYSVPGKDYLFINGNESDFRHENLRIINPYLGVHAVNKKGQIRYQARINIPGYYIIGYYLTVEEAAIAYNKAIDIVKKNGCKKAYTANYIEDFSPTRYADIYAKAKISHKIKNLTF